MMRKIFKVIGDKLFDICFEIVWMKKWMLWAIICTGLVLFWISSLSYHAALTWNNVPPRNELQQVSGRILGCCRKRGDPHGDPLRLEFIMDDGNRYYAMNSIMDDVYPKLGEIRSGGSVELLVYKFGNSRYEPRIVEISRNGVCYLSYEEGVMLYKEDAQHAETETKWMVVAGLFCCMYGIVFLIVQRLLS